MNKLETEQFVNRYAAEKCETMTDLYMFIGYLAKCVDQSKLERFYGNEIREMGGEQNNES